MGEFTLNSTGNEINSALSKVKGLNNTAGEINKVVDCILNQKIVKTNAELAAFGTKATDTVYDLSEIIPNDNHAYRIWLSFRVRSSTEKDAYMAIFFKTNHQKQIYGGCVVNQVSGSRQQHIDTACITMGGDERSLEVLHYTGTNGDYELFVSGYERLD
jgi:hypothetical protein